MRRQLSRRRPSPHPRGFTLIELVVVVVIITILATLSVPTMTRKMQDRRVQQAAQDIATLYRTARMRAMGRGSAVMVRYTAVYGFEMREAVQGVNAPAPDCAQLPMNSCLNNNWALASQFRALDRFVPAQADLTQTIDATLRLNGATALTDPVDMCFTPTGRAFLRSGGAAFQSMTNLVTVDVQRKYGGTGQGLIRTVALLPNGAARL